MGLAACAAKALAAALAASALASPAPLPGGLSATAPKGWVLALSEPDQAVWTRPAPGTGYAPNISLERRDGGRREAAAFESRRRAGAASKASAAGLAGRRFRLVERAASPGEHGSDRKASPVTTEIVVLARDKDFLTIAFSAPSAEFAGLRRDFDAFLAGLAGR